MRQLSKQALEQLIELQIEEIRLYQQIDKALMAIVKQEIIKRENRPGLP